MIRFERTRKKYWQSGYFYFLPVVRISWKEYRRIPNEERGIFDPCFVQERSLDLIWLTFKLSFTWNAWF